MNAVFVAGDVVIRVGHTTAPPSSARWLAGHLAAHDIRVPGVLDLVPVHDGDMTAIVAERVHGTGDVNWREVGEMVRRLHALDPAVVAAHYPVPWAPSFPWWQHRVLLDDVAVLLDADVHRAVGTIIERCAGWPRAMDQVGEVLCHGDVHPGNVVAGPHGAVLLDWDLLCTASWQWDHAALARWAMPWGGDPDIFQNFIEGYGKDARGDWIGEALADLRLVSAFLMRVRAGRSDDMAAEEARRRAAFFVDPAVAPVWVSQ
jgi:Ser/Thr protein kinase RdoA (MazF antagonist)